MIKWNGLTGEGKQGRRYEIMRVLPCESNKHFDGYILTLPTVTKNFRGVTIADCKHAAEEFEAYEIARAKEHGE